ncbi:MAG TPA: TnsD family Tn7-like transposition protein [Flavitalea sp.]|nr:TnsD family Tn7-like transposition protein [Flavitalea sp.]
MLPYFPTPYQDELHYSVIARYGVHCGVTSSKELLRDLFHQANVSAVMDFPGHLKTFTQCLGAACSLSTDDWIQYHTLYPAFLAFIPGNRQKMLVKSACGDNAGNIHTRLGICASSIRPTKYLRVCKECQREQRERFGEVYWQRSLQMPGVIFCPHHEIPLLVSSTHYHPMGKFDFQAAEHAQIVATLDSANMQKSSKLLTELSQLVYQVLHAQCDKKMSFEKLTHYYSVLAEEHGLKNKTRVNHAEVAEKFYAYWKKPCDQLLPNVLNNNSSWLTQLFRKHRKSFHPLYHLMVWQSFNVTDPSVTLHKICNLPARQQPKIIRNQLPSSHQVKDHRAAWTLVCKQNPTVGVKWLRYEAHADAIYLWLYRNDREWLQSNSPMRIKATPRDSRVNWQKRDKSFLKDLRILNAKDSTKNIKVRRSKSWYIKNSNSSSTLEKHIDKLPLCKNFIDSHSESVEEFQRRRIIASIRSLLAENEELKPWRIIRRAGIRKEFLSNALLKFIYKHQGLLGNGAYKSNFPPHS